MVSRLAENRVAAPADVTKCKAGPPHRERRLYIAEMLGVFDEAIAREHDVVAVLQGKARRILRLDRSMHYRGKQCSDKERRRKRTKWVHAD